MDRGRWLRRLAVGVVVAVLGGLLVVGGRDGPRAPTRELADEAPTGVEDEVLPPVLLPDGPTTGRQFATRGSVLWGRLDLDPVPRAGDVRAAGADHVLVGDRLLRTGGAAPQDALLRLPDPATTSAFDRDGRWAVAEFGRVVLGGVTTSVTDVVPDGWRPTGAAVAWFDGDPAFRDDAGHLGLLGDDGLARWRTAEAVTLAGTVGPGWLAVARADGSAAVVGLADGRLVDLPAPALAVHGDHAVTRPGDVVAIDLRDGGVAWRRPATGATWRALSAAFVAEESGAAVLVDPATGSERDRVEGTTVVATDEVAVVRGEDGIEAISWAGRSRWRLRLAASATVLAVDAARVAVRADPPAGARVTVLEAATGLVVANAVPPAADDPALVLAGDELRVVVSGEVVATVDRRTGQDVARGATARSTDEVLRFGAGELAVTVDVGAATLRGATADATLWTLPLRAPLAAPPVQAGTSVLVLLADGTVAAVGPRDGAVRWRRELDVVPTAAASDGTMLLVGTVDGQVLRLDPSGQVVTRTSLGGGRVAALVAGRPAAALVGGRLVGIDIDGSVGAT